MNFTVARNVVIEEVGEDVLVLVPGQSDVIRLTGELAQTIRMIRSGVAVQPEDDITANLLQRDIITGSVGMSRRGFVTATAVGAGVGISTLALPSLVAASSPLLPILSLTGLGFSGLDDDGRTFGIVFDPEAPGTGWPNPQPSADRRDVSALSVNGVSVPLNIADDGSEDVIDPENRVLIWGPIESLRDIDDPIVGTFVWKRQPFEVTFERTEN